MYRVREKVAEWGAEHHPDVLRRAIECWIGPHEPEEGLMGQAIQFAVIAPFEGPSMAERYREASGKLSRADREVFKAWGDAWYGVLEIEDVLPGEGLLLRDALTGERFEVLERLASTQCEVGDWLAAVMVPVGDHIELEGSIMALAGPAAIVAVQAFAAGLEKPAPALTRRETMERMADVVRSVRSAQRLPRLVNHDGDPILLITVQLEHSWDEIASVLADWEDAEFDEDHVSIIADAPEGRPGRVVIGAFDREGDSVELFVNSEGRLERVLRMWHDRVGTELVVGERESTEAPGDPDGPDTVMDTSLVFAEEDPYSGWPDVGIPALDGLTPREALARGREAEVRALLPYLDGDEMELLRADLGIDPPAFMDYRAWVRRLPPYGTWEACTVLLPAEDGDVLMMVLVDLDADGVVGAQVEEADWEGDLYRQMLLADHPSRPKLLLCRAHDVELLEPVAKDLRAKLSTRASLPSADFVALSVFDAWEKL